MADSPPSNPLNLVNVQRFHQVMEKHYQGKANLSVMDKKYSSECEDSGLKFTQQELYETHLHQRSLEEEEAQMGALSTAELVSGRAQDGDMEKTFKQVYNCLTCGKNYKYLVSFKKHQRRHKRTSSKANEINRDVKVPLRNEENVEKSDDGNSDKRCSAECEARGLKFPQQELYRTRLHQRALEEEEAQMGELRTTELVSGRADPGENRNEDTGGDAASMKNTLTKTYNCLTCGKNYKYLVSFKKHQQLHRRTSCKVNKLNKDMKGQLRENVEQSEGGISGESVNRDSSVESECREPVHHSEVSKLSVSADRSDKSKSEDVQSETRGELDENKEHIECKDCGLNFTHWENYKTHLHQHALEEEEAQIEDQRTAELVCGRANRDEDAIGDAAECDSSNSAPTMTCDLIQSVGASTLRKAYACLICGKIYTYMVSFKKHQRLHQNESPAAATTGQSPSNQNLRKYECPYCGMLFIRRTRLIGHLKVHRSCRSLNSTHRRCDTCSKDFASTGEWMAHAELHKQNPFWCLSCARGFKDEASLDEHLQTHDRRHRGFRTSAQLTSHFSSHSEAKQGFSSPRKFISHQKRPHTAAENLGGQIRKGALLPCVKEEPDINTDREEPPELEESAQKASIQSTCEKFGDRDTSDESDCGEPVYHFKLSGKPSSADVSNLRSEDLQSQTRAEPDEAESQGVIDHKYWEWECFECDMGFDEVAKLHSHYIKHATGELPILWDTTEG